MLFLRSFNVNSRIVLYETHKPAQFACLKLEISSPESQTGCQTVGASSRFGVSLSVKGIDRKLAECGLIQHRRSKTHSCY